jgi:hypothetical protein
MPDPSFPKINSLTDLSSIRVQNSIGGEVPLSLKIIEQHALLGGDSKEDAKIYAHNIASIIVWSDKSIVTTNAIRVMLYEQRMPGGPDVNSIKVALNMSLSRAEPLVKITDEVIESEFHIQSLSDMPTSLFEYSQGLISALGNIDGLTDSDDSPLSQLISHASDYSAFVLGRSPELREHLTSFNGILNSGKKAAETQASFYEWCFSINTAIEGLIKDHEAPDPGHPEADGYQRLDALYAIKTTFQSAQSMVISTHVGLNIDWQIVIVEMFALILWSPWYGLYDWVEDTATGCPPCPSECPILNQTHYVTGYFSNPKKCGPVYLKKQVKIKIKKLKIVTIYIWEQACTWDIVWKHRLVSSCYKSRLRAWLLGTGSCCTSVYDWVTKETVQHTFRITTRSSSVPPFPKNQEVHELLKAPKEIPSEARRLRRA